MKLPDTNMLYLRGEYWNYKRKVPRRYKHIEPRTMIRVALNTKSLDIARVRRNALAEADDIYWATLAIEADKNGGVSEATRKVQESHYQSACSRALAYGFIYKTAQQIYKENAVDELLDRTEVLATKYSQNHKLPDAETTALLGGIEKPVAEKLTVLEAFQLYVDEIAFDSLLKKSPAQKKSWEKAKRTSINYFVQAIGNLDMENISREQAITYRNWWGNRIKSGDENGDKPIPYTANRHMGNMRTLYREFYAYRGQEDRPNPFRKLSFKVDRNNKKKKRPPFETAWLRDRFLVPGLFKKVNPEVRHILYALIETGARPSEICNLKPENIRLNEPVPYLAIRATENREIKASASDRDIPLLGISLAAMRANPNGFPRYFDKETNFSASIMKALKNRDLLPTYKHSAYSIRHSFEKRMLEAHLDYGLRCLLMGHKNERPDYGDGGSLAYRREELMKIAFPYDGWEI